MTTIAVISDTHLNHHMLKIPEVDILIHCGDFSNMGRETEIMNFAKWLHEQPCEKAIVISGNHDFLFQRNSYLAQTLLMRNDGLTTSKKVVYLQDQAFEYKGIKFYGTPWVNQFYDWAFMKPDLELKKIFDKIPEDTDMLITHGPPRNILDMNNYGIHCGSPSLAQKVKQLKLKYCLFGHIHPAHGTVKIDDTIYINAASLNDNYEIYKTSPFLINV